jgi:hypothetical protein
MQLVLRVATLPDTKPVEATAQLSFGIASEQDDSS